MTIKIIKIMVYSLFVMSLLGCMTSQNHRSLSCQRQCIERWQQCQQQCENNCQSCAVKSYSKTKKAHQKYVNEECVKGGFIARELNSFNDPLQCRKVSCNCSTDLDICKQSCRGVVKKKLQPAVDCLTTC